jgi:ubiquinone/menaquinone biosynthesis C-methylase UbiE
MNKAQKFWDKQAKRFADSQKQFEPASQEIIARTKEYLNANDNVLDFGCATGIKTLVLADGIKHIHGLDFSAGMISEAIESKNKANAPNVSFSHGTIFNNDLVEASFDKIIAYIMV